MARNGSPPTPRAPAGQLRLTPRGTLVLGLAAALVLLLLASLLRSCATDEPEAAVPAAASDSAATPATGATPSRPSNAAASTRPTSAGATPGASAPPAGASSVRDGIVTSDERGSREWRTAGIELPTSHPDRARPHRYVVKVKTSLGLDASQVARQVQGVLDDERSCVGSTANSFSLVTDEEQADMCSTWPPRTPRSPCAGRCVRRTWSCNTGARVVLNADRWRWMTPTYTDRVQYRAYLVNHEVGHSIGLGHVGCPGPGRPAPVMMQQSKSLGGCQVNPWPAASGWR